MSMVIRTSDLRLHFDSFSTVDNGAPTASFRVDPNFRVNYTPSMRSNTSRTSTVTSVFKGVMRRVSGKKPRERSFSETVDGVPVSEQPPVLGRKTLLSRQTSSVSLRGNLSPRHQADAFSISSQKTGKSSRTTRTSASKGPPSAYKSRRIGKYSNGPDETGQGDESSAELRSEISAVEEEMQQVLRSFEGLEVSASARHRPGLGPGASPYTPTSHPIVRSNLLWAGTPERTNLPPVPPLPPPPPLPSTGPSVAERKVSLGVTEITPAKAPKSSFFSRKKSTPILSTAEQKRVLSESVPTESPIPPPPPLSHDLNANTVTPRSDPKADSIRRRKEETKQRYNERLEYLRARLKGAELRERLIK